MTKFEQFFGFAISRNGIGTCEMFHVSKARYDAISDSFCGAVDKNLEKINDLSDVVEIAVEQAENIGEALTMLSLVMDKAESMGRIIAKGKKDRLVKSN